jgi:hypothetical protein
MKIGFGAIPGIRNRAVFAGIEFIQKKVHFRRVIFLSANPPDLIEHIIGDQNLLLKTAWLFVHKCQCH